MAFRQIIPPNSLQGLVQCYWIVDDERPKPRQQKIIPDGFSEMIFHFGDPYRINLAGSWQLQSRALVAGQIRRFFYLENTGRSSIIGIKFRPTALTHLYGLRMSTLTDRVEPLLEMTGEDGRALSAAVGDTFEFEAIVGRLNQHLEDLARKAGPLNSPIDAAVNRILDAKGMVTTAWLTDQVHLGERQLERLFKHYVGVSPKFYARIVRFNAIFDMIQHKMNWLDIVERAGFYDQPHFIRNFREFTGEDPSMYAFEARNLANFFLMPPTRRDVGFIQ
ncbi:MAG TPA: helix-turn-helix domain-containing protein [Chryseosolibacter sp.]|nr:helix-turn-helix domain-containing protein [Chryseosolibacter sp.]